MSKTISLSELEQTLSERKLSDIHKSLADFPHFSLLKDMDKATDRIVQAIKNNEVIYVLGDFDCDGIVSTAIMVDFFSKIGCKINYIIPDRHSDGYGISLSVLKKIDYADLLITVDNGIVASAEVTQYCYQNNIDLVVTDHHTPGEVLPDCYAVINPKRKDCLYPFKDICGAQVAFLLCCSIKQKMGLDINMTQFLDILALAVVGDVMQLKNINRHIVIKGIQIMNTFNRKFFQSLAGEMKKEFFKSEDISFQIVPRLNAAGRLFSASLSVEALLCNDENSFRLVSNLNDINTERKEIQLQVLKDARLMINEDDLFNVIVGEELHEGIVGIVASKIAEETNKPTLILSSNNGILKGSGRSVGNVNIYNIINSCSELLIKGGGHSGAFGLSINEKNLIEFKKRLQKQTALISKDLFISKAVVIGSLNAQSIGVDILKILDRFAPYGEANPAPLFKCVEAKVVHSKPMGKDNNHTTLIISFDGVEIRIALFNCDFKEFITGDFISFDYSISLNEWLGKKSAQINPINIIKKHYFDN